MARDIASLVSTLAEAMQFQHEFDSRLRSALSHVLADLGSGALVARIGADASVFTVLLGDSLPGVSETEFGQTVELHLDVKIDGHQNPVSILESEVQGALYRIYLIIPEANRNGEGGGRPRPRKLEFCAFLFGGNFPEHYRARNGNPIELSDAGLLGHSVIMALRFRQKILEQFPTRLSEEYWHAARDGKHNRVSVPYDVPDPQLTVTLALDLRRSTFGMERSLDQMRYAHWIEEFILILKRCAHDNFGVFDKFTGDGAIVHFLAKECERFGQRILARDTTPRAIEPLPTAFTASLLATKCAWEMISAVSHHLKRLRSGILTLDNSAFGPAVGLALDFAAWSADRDGQPIVVGRGIVDACRASSACPAYSVYMTKIIESCFTASGTHDYEMEQARYISKEYGPDAAVLITSAGAPPRKMCRSDAEMYGICLEIYENLSARNRPSNRAS